MNTELLFKHIRGKSKRQVRNGDSHVVIVYCVLKTMTDEIQQALIHVCTGKNTYGRFFNGSRIQIINTYIRTDNILYNAIHKLLKGN